MAQREELKLDIYVVDIQDGARALLLLNFNIPNRHLVDPPGYHQLLNEAAAFLQRELTAQNITFQVSATYYLTNKVTGEERTWTGSFNYSSQNLAVLSGPDFLPFDGATFARRVAECTTQDNILDCLQWSDEDTDWTFSEIISIVVSCQTSLPRHHGFLLAHGLLQGGGGAARRRICLPHPW